MTFASVCLLDVPYAADRMYTYAVPETVDAKVGDLVSVPFGKSDRRRVGAVVGLSDECSSENVKPLIEVSSREPLLDEEALALCFYLKETTLCTFGEAFRAMVPSAAVSRTRTVLSLPEELPGEISSLDEDSRALVEKVMFRGKMLQKELSSDAEEEKRASRLVREGWLVKENETVYGETNRKFVTYYELSLSPEETERALELSVRRSSAQREILEAMIREGRRLSETELFSLSRENATPVRMKALEKKGLVTSVKEEVYRNPFLLSGVASEKTELSEEQKKVFGRLKELFDTGKPSAALLYGVTGSGKTAVIREMIREVLAKGRGVIVLVPEIALTPQTVSIFVGVFGQRVAVIHSSLSQGERYDAFRRIRSGEADVVIGTRSAVFAPVRDLGLIVIDEEQEHTYKSDTDPKYLAHDVARFRIARSGGMMLLASATPSVVSYHKAVSGNYELVKLEKRYGNARLPEVKIVDMKEELRRGNASSLSFLLREMLLENSEKNLQSIIFLNRRGYHSTLTCPSCGEVVRCPRCSVALTFHTRHRVSEGSREDYLARHRDAGHLECHYCGFQSPVPDSCPACGNAKLVFLGLGTQKTEDELRALLPDGKIVRMDMDTTGGKYSHEEILRSFREGDSKILLGTQMVTKGHDFPKVTLVGVVNADSSLYQDDFRASERTFDMITQVIGRAGRNEDPGYAVIQTMNPGSDVIALAARQDYPAFYDREIVIRKVLTYPPFCDIALVHMSSENEVLLQQEALGMLETIKKKLEGAGGDVPMMIFGPFEAPVYRVRNRYRMRLVIKCKLNRKSRAVFSELLTEKSRNPKDKTWNLGIDFNPSSI
ncbi:MAG: primosomal protein N' [Clostridia bacterium]|nr:primosomal protein N' [Clostridia bacterium]